MAKSRLQKMAEKWSRALGDQQDVSIGVGDKGLSVYIHRKTDEIILKVAQTIGIAEGIPVTFHYVGPIKPA